jgi:hypothetical protein
MEALEIYKTKKKINLKLTVKIEIYVLMQKNYVIFVKELEVKEMKNMESITSSIKYLKLKD